MTDPVPPQPEDLSPRLQALTLTEPKTNHTIDPSDSNNSQYDWLTLIPTMLEQHHLTCTEQTIESAQKLQEAGLLGNFTEKAASRADPQSSPALSTFFEASLLEMFLEDSYDGLLHLTTLDITAEGTPVGFVFWREMPIKEMKEWIHWENLKKRLLGEQDRKRQDGKLKNSNLENAMDGSEEENFSEESDLLDEQDAPAPVTEHQDMRRRMRQSLRQVRSQSIRWLEIASNGKDDDDGDDDDDSGDNNQRLSLLDSSFSASITNGNTSRRTSTILEGLTHSWVKIELLMVHPDHWKHHLGTLLLACAMYQAYQHGEEHMILHVAGGKENVPAQRLYEKFGFIEVPEGTVFDKPDRDLFILGHVAESLQQLCWPALEM